MQHHGSLAGACFVIFDGCMLVSASASCSCLASRPYADHADQPALHLSVILLSDLMLRTKTGTAPNGRACTSLQGPQIITIPDFGPNRFWIIPLQDAYTNTYASLGSDYNTAAGQYLIVGRSKFLLSLLLLYCTRQLEAHLAHYPDLV